jgi:hypothetical protein
MHKEHIIALACIILLAIVLTSALPAEINLYETAMAIANAGQ